MKLVRDWWLPDGEVHLDEWIAREGSYQGPHRANALKHVQKWDVALDVGGHVGLWSRELSEKFRLVHAFEPVPEHRDCFWKNVTNPNVLLHPYALGDEEKRVAMVTEPHSTGGTHVDPVNAGDVPMRTLDSFGFEEVDFLKIDCEGYELYILKGAKETLLRCKPVICIEQKPHPYFGNHQYAASKWLLDLGAKFLSGFKADLVYGW